MNLAKSAIVFLLLMEFLMMPCSGSDEIDSSPVMNVTCNNTGMVTMMALEAGFSGTVYSQGYHMNPPCRYDVRPRTTNASLPFFFPMNDCGIIVEESDGYIYFSTFIVIQKFRLIETTWDVVHNASCKFPLSDGDFYLTYGHGTRLRPVVLDDLKSWMEFLVGPNISSTKLAEKLIVGEEFLLAVNIVDGGRNKDVRVTYCWAHDKHTISASQYVTELIDARSCRPSIWTSEFKLVSGANNVSDKIVFARVKALKFPSTMQLQVTCSIEVCTNSCFEYCKEPESSRNNQIIPSRKLGKRSIVSRPSNKITDERIRLLKSTIKSLGAALIKNRKGRSQSENSADFYKRVLKPTSSVPSENDKMLETDKDEVKTSQTYVFANDNIGSRTRTEVAYEASSVNDGIWNNVYHFNLTTKVIMLSSQQSKQTSKILFNSSTELKACVYALPLDLATGILSVIVLILIPTSVSLYISLQKEKKKTQNNILMYNFI